MSKVITADAAVELIKDHATVAFGGMGLGGWPECLARALARRFYNTGHPVGLNLKQGASIGDWRDRGTTTIGIEGMVDTWTGAHVGSSANMRQLVQGNKIKAYCLPQGVIVNLWREIAAKRPGLITKVGLGTFVDPRIEGGKFNSVTTEDIVKMIQFEGEEWLFYKSFPVDVALLRATVCDEDGNMTIEHEGFIYEALQIAEATKNSGGIVIVQTEYLARRGTLNAQKVEVPADMVDYIVIAEDKNDCWQGENVYYEPSFSGETRIPLDEIPKLPLNDKKVIARRCAAEIRRGDLVNLGYGMPANVASILAEHDASDIMTLTTEAGVFGGVPAVKANFGNTYNPDAMINHSEMFNYYDGGGLDVTFLGLAQADSHGNVNVIRFGNKIIGCGGFINISQNTPKCVFCGSFTNGAKTVVEDGRLKIIEEGKNVKFTKDVECISFSGAYAGSVHQEVMFITERAVLKLINGKMTVTEIAPGVDLEKDILGQMDFRPEIAEDLKLMEPGMFEENWQGIEEWRK